MKEEVIYRDSKHPVSVRVDDLLARMTREEKIGQLVQVDGRKTGVEDIKERHFGSFLHVLGEETAELIDEARKSRLGIPLLLGIDAIHGYSFWTDATIFPTQLTMACSWNDDLIEKCAAITAREMFYTGTNWTFSPVLCLSRDLRWGRVGETFGEDPYLIGRFSSAMIRGYQGDDMSAPEKVMATAKHYAGYSETQGGRDASEADLSRRKLLSYFLPPFEKAARAGAGAFMTGYQSMEGLPSTVNTWLLKDILREKWNFKGILLTDWDNVGTLISRQKICSDYSAAAAKAVSCGNDIMMGTPEFYEGALQALDAGSLSEEDVDTAVGHVLKMKFNLGLFENDRYPDLSSANEIIGSKEHRHAALELARESAVLLRNESILPLNEFKIKTIAVIGPNAEDVRAQLGDWSTGVGHGIGEMHSRKSTITVLDGIRTRFSGEVLYQPGCGIKEKNLDLIASAVEAAENANLAIVVIGDQHHLVGETRSTATLELQGGQRELIDALKATGKPLVFVLINSKPLVLPEAVYNGDAVLEMFSPGMLGGQACAEILFGDINPSGKLPISFPYHVGQQPVYYSQVRGQHGDRYADMTQDPLYAFGEGYSYTEYEYGEIQISREELDEHDTLSAEIEIRNIGQREGTEIVQLYIRDLVTSATWVDKELKGFSRLTLKPGEIQKARFELPVSECSIVDWEGNRVVEPGEFELLIGSSSREKDLKKKKFSYNRDL